MTSYSCRAECQIDVTNFLTLAAAVGSPIRIGKFTAEQEDFDTLFEFTSDNPIEHVLDVMRQVVDSHVMIQTLRPVPLEENDLERDYDKH